MTRSTLVEAIRVPFSVRAWIAVGSIACAIGVGGCAPSVDNDGCGVDSDCEGRGQICDVEASECVDKPTDSSSTGTAAAAFTDLAVPFHRGTICYAESVQAGQKVPVSLSPCLHPCIDLAASSYFHKNYYSCSGSSCEAWAFVYYVVDGAGCPGDAFGAFDRTMCQFPDAPIDLRIGSTIGEGQPVIGTMTLEVPFLTNEDVAAIHAGGGDIDLMRTKIDQYPQFDNRVAGDISLRSDNPAPAEVCDGVANCTCKDIGF